MIQKGKKMELNCIKKMIISCDHSDLELLIKEVYHCDYEIMPMEEVGSSQYAATYPIHVKAENLDGYQTENIQSLIDKKPNQFILGDIMTHLCNQGIIEEGEYVIDVNW